MDKDLLKIKRLLLQYIDIIKNEYFDYIPKYEKDYLCSTDNLVEFNKNNSISFFVINRKLLLPKAAYNIFPLFKNYENYGIKPNSHRSTKEYLDTNTTYMQYIDHVIEGALSVYDYFEESLLHEAMHLCGSQGGLPLEEGINELKTRELAQKYKLKIAAYGYSKEVEIAKRLQDIIGKEIMDELTFVKKNDRYQFISIKVSSDKAQLYELVSNRMIDISKDYFDNINEIDNPYEKAKLYETIDYSELYNIIDNYKIERIIK